MNIIHPAIIWEIEKRHKREIETDHRVPLYAPVPEHEPEAPAKEIDYVIEF